ncbi:MAG: ATP-binding cassette domain-containing protein [Bifidobacteriaceae bacterium]|nr:ATP-binding cassette domain-containing protein [Bifidobacteriaceae bacterium]
MTIPSSEHTSFALKGSPVLSVRNATCSTDSTTVFSNLDLDLYSGEIVDLTGASGAGKSSLLTIIAQLNPRGNATLSLHDTDSTRFSYQQWRRRVAYVPQKPTLLGDTVASAIRLPWTLKAYEESEREKNAPFALSPATEATAPDDSSLRASLDAIGCADVELDRHPRDLSGGQAARVCLLRTILTRPAVLLADEVDAGLDDDNALKVSAMMTSAAEEGMAILRIRHRASDGHESRTVVLKDGVLK